ncbi:hypothetical protein CHUAL_003875 [Chamberlinius hualienensis]
MTQEDDHAWFHGKISRETAERLLKSGDLVDGRFLVRESTTAIGDYVLSLLHDNHEVIHYQIRKHDEDAFFSIDEGPIIHGLETLIEYYRKDASGLSTKLGPFVRGQAPPADCRLHGRTNLLHRATKEGNYTVVDELLKSGYHSLDAKNQDGQTALHLASILGYNDVVRRLIEAGASVNTRDGHGLTPLHYACQTNRPTTVRILLDVGLANYQARSCHDGWVAMHEAASRGHTECVKLLLASNASSHPRTDLNETPKDLALNFGHWDCADLLDNYKPPNPKNSYTDWFHENISREYAQDILIKSGFKEGAYLIRTSSRKTGMFVLSVFHDDHMYNFEIQREGKFFFIDNGPYLESLEHLVGYYATIADGLPTRLQNPVRSVVPCRQPETSTILVNNILLSDFSNFSVDPPELPMDINRNNHSVEYASNNKNIENRGSLSLDIKQIFLDEHIGEGEFGSVFRGRLEKNGTQSEVAVKTLRDESIHEGQACFTKEAAVMMNLDHPCIVKLLGFSLGPPMMLVQELMSGGSLYEYLLDNGDTIFDEEDDLVAKWASDVADGMLYLEQKHFVHRDLAARNILLTTNLSAKITDFGLSRAVGTGRDYYKASKGGKWPVKWYAPESVNFGTFSHASDVWSFGVTLWEINSCGLPPYGDLTGAQVIALIEREERLPKPDMCSDELYQIMLKCWASRPEDRLTFVELKSIFNYENLRELQSHDQPQLDVKQGSSSTATVSSEAASSALSSPTIIQAKTNLEKHQPKLHPGYFQTTFDDCLDDIVEV